MFNQVERLQNIVKRLQKRIQTKRYKQSKQSYQNGKTVRNQNDKTMKTMSEIKLNSKLQQKPQLIQQQSYQFKPTYYQYISSQLNIPSKYIKQTQTNINQNKQPTQQNVKKQQSEIRKSQQYKPKQNLNLSMFNIVYQKSDKNQSKQLSNKYKLKKSSEISNKSSEIPTKAINTQDQINNKPNTIIKPHNTTIIDNQNHPKQQQHHFIPVYRQINFSQASEIQQSQINSTAISNPISQQFTQKQPYQNTSFALTKVINRNKNHYQPFGININFNDDFQFKQIPQQQDQQQQSYYNFKQAQPLLVQMTQKLASVDYSNIFKNVGQCLQKDNPKQALKQYGKQIRQQVRQIFIEVNDMVTDERMQPILFYMIDAMSVWSNLSQQ